MSTQRLEERPGAIAAIAEADLRELSQFFTDSEGTGPVQRPAVEEKDARNRVGTATEAPLPADRAFVVQLRAQVDPSAELFVGRIEHIASGDAARFGSAQYLLAFIAKVLGRGPSSSGEPPASAPEEPGEP